MAVLNDMQEAFCQAYVANGGNAKRAAESAGYRHAQVLGSVNLRKAHVADRIRQLTALDLSTRLGQLVQIALDIATDPLASHKDRLKAVEMLLDRGGLAIPRGSGGPSVAVQVNVATTAHDAQAAIKEIETLRLARLTSLDSADFD